MSWWYWAAPMLAALLLHRAWARYNERALLRDWRMLLTREGRRQLDALQLQTDMDTAAAAAAVQGAAKARSHEDVDEAVRLLQLGCAALEAATPDRIRRLRGMAVCARMASAIVPVAPLRPKDFRLRRLATLAGMGQLVHQVLVGTGERFALRLRLLRIAFPLAVHALSRARWKATASPQASAAWALFEAGVEDWRTLDREHVESFRALLVSLAAEPTEDVATARLQ